MNDFQMRKSKNREVTGKVTTQNIINQHDVVSQHRPSQRQQMQQMQAQDSTPSFIKSKGFSMKTPT